MTLLSRVEATLPSAWYYDPGHYALELDAIWYRDWVCIGRLDEIANVGDYRVVSIGTQRLILTRDADGQPRVFHNTCRHRGAALCTTERGRFRRARIICPYHTWTYALDGSLVATPGRIETDDFEPADYSLYAVHADVWGGFVFACLAETPETSLQTFVAGESGLVECWPLADMISVHQQRKRLACNWKVFWENYSECYHCPRVHPELCRVVPVYKQGVLNYRDLDEWQPRSAADDGRPRVAEGYSTWTLDGQTALPVIPGLDERDIEAGMTFCSVEASMFVIAHPDYVRSVRMLPAGPEAVDLVVDWLLLPEVAATHAEAFDKLFELGRIVVEQDGRVCEINQQGLKSRRHTRGVLVPQEHSLWEFHSWLRSRLGVAQG